MTCAEDAEPKNSINGDIYLSRKDVIAIKSELMELIPNDEYWRVIKMFVYGKCSKQYFDEIVLKYLTTKRARKLHNNFFKSILFNSHFSSIPPPNIRINPQKRGSLSHQEKAKPTRVLEFNANGFADLLRLPSFSILSHKISQMLQKIGQNAQDDAIQVIHHELYQFVIHLLLKCLDFVDKTKNYPRKVQIQVKHLDAAISSTQQVSAFLSSGMLSKISRCTK